MVKEKSIEISEYNKQQELNDFLKEFCKESPRGAVLLAAALIDTYLEEILSHFFVDDKVSKNLLNRSLRNASSRMDTAYALGLIDEEEHKEIKTVNSIRNEFAHSWRNTSFDTPKIIKDCKDLPWLGSLKIENPDARERFQYAVGALILGLMFRASKVAEERRVSRTWYDKTRKYKMFNPEF